MCPASAQTSGIWYEDEALKIAIAPLTGNASAPPATRLGIPSQSPASSLDAGRLPARRGAQSRRFAALVHKCSDPWRNCTDSESGQPPPESLVIPPRVDPRPNAPKMAPALRLWTCRCWTRCRASSNGRRRRPRLRRSTLRRLRRCRRRCPAVRSLWPRSPPDWKRGSAPIWLSSRTTCRSRRESPPQSRRFWKATSLRDTRTSRGSSAFAKWKHTLRTTVNVPDNGKLERLVQTASGFERKRLAFVYDACDIIARLTARWATSVI